MEPIEKNGFFSTYLKENNLTIQLFKAPKFKQFLFNQLKSGKRKSLEKFFFNVFKIVKSVIQKRLKADKKTYIEIYNKVSQQIC